MPTFCWLIWFSLLVCNLRKGGRTARRDDVCVSRRQLSKSLLLVRAERSGAACMCIGHNIWEAWDCLHWTHAGSRGSSGGGGSSNGGEWGGGQSRCRFSVCILGTCKSSHVKIQTPSKEGRGDESGGEKKKIDQWLSSRCLSNSDGLDRRSGGVEGVECGVCLFCYPPKLFLAFGLSAHSTVKSYTNSLDVCLCVCLNTCRIWAANIPVGRVSCIADKPESCDFNPVFCRQFFLY